VRNCQNALNAGRVPFISVNWKAELFDHVTAQPNNVGGTGKTLFRYYADGHFDGDPVTGMVNVPGVGSVPGFRKLGMEILKLVPGECPTAKIGLTPWHEFEDTKESGFGTTKTTQGWIDFRAGWQRLINVLRGMGVDEDRIVIGFCGASGVGTWGSSLTDTGSSGFYPGHNFVDLIMWDPYNSSGLISAGGGEPAGGRSKNPWRNFGVTGDRGDGFTAAAINRWGQMAWWYGRFKVGGKPTLAEVVSTEGVYKPVWLGEYGTGTHDKYNDPTNPLKRATVWFDNLPVWLAEDNEIIKGIIYFNNPFNNVNVGPYRPEGFDGTGLATVWAVVT
jgi:hypothetical protein